MKPYSAKPAPYPIQKLSGFPSGMLASLPSLKEGKFLVIQAAIAGDAPKDFLRIYNHGEGRRSRPKSWPAWIAKVGHKHYPNESITEHLLTRIGQALGLNMADSRLMCFGEQLRFLSRYFLKNDSHSLVHGAEIFEGYLQDRAFVETVEKQNEARNIFTFQFVEEALQKLFPGEWQDLRVGFARLLAFDAIVGNNDRHFYNWGVIVDIMGRRATVFSPIYDTARALYWNTSENVLMEIARDKNRHKIHLEKYVTNCFPKTGWDGLQAPNHFKLIQSIAEGRPELGEVLRQLPADGIVKETQALLETEFRGLISPLRSSFVLECLDRRARLFRSAIR